MTMKLGSKGERVKELQGILGIAQDGDFGPQTDKAVREYQKNHGLQIDGIVGPQTWLQMSKPEVKYTMAQIRDAVTDKGYDWFSVGDYNINIVGIRNSDTKGQVTNRYDDHITVSYRLNGSWEYVIWEATTDPGAYWIDNPSNTNGTAILVPDQYKGVYKIDYHGGKYKALCQRNGKVRVYRDGNRDDEYDYEEDTIQDGYFGINIHRSSAYKVSNYVNKYSAGCQVFADPDDFDDFMRIIYKVRDAWGNKFTYTLIESKDIK